MVHEQTFFAGKKGQDQEWTGEWPAYEHPPRKTCIQAFPIQYNTFPPPLSLPLTYTLSVDAFPRRSGWNTPELPTSIHFWSPWKKCNQKTDQRMPCVIVLDYPLKCTSNWPPSHAVLGCVTLSRFERKEEEGGWVGSLITYPDRVGRTPPPSSLVMSSKKMDVAGWFWWIFLHYKYIHPPSPSWNFDSGQFCRYKNGIIRGIRCRCWRVVSRKIWNEKWEICGASCQNGNDGRILSCGVRQCTI